MKQTVKAVIDEQGHVRLTEPVDSKRLHRALVTMLDEPPERIGEMTQFAEKAWAKSG